MLDEYVNDLKAKIAERLEDGRNQLEGGADPTYRGECRAYRAVLADVDELLARYATPEDVPPELQEVERVEDAPRKKPRVAQVRFRQRLADTRKSYGNSGRAA